MSCAHPGASPSIGPWGTPSVAPSRLPSTSALFGDLVGHPRRCTSCGEAQSRGGGPSEVNHSIPTAPHSYSRVQLKAVHGPGHTVGCTQPPWRRRGACSPTAARPLPPRWHCAGRESPHLPERAQIDMGGGGVWEACLGPTLALAHPLGHGGYLRQRHPACQAPMRFLAISSGIPGGAGPVVRHGAVVEGHQKVNRSIPTAPNSY